MEGSIKAVFSTNGAGTARYPYKNIGINHHLISFSKVNIKLMTDLKEKAKFIKFLEENIIENLSDIGLSKDFLSKMQKKKVK